jgi:ATP-dependent DNA helicase RecQ
MCSIRIERQEAGRAGRDGEPAVCTILYRVEDRRVQSYFLGGKYSELHDAERVVQAFGVTTNDSGEGLTVADVATATELARTKVRLTLMMLKDRGATAEQRGGRWERVDGATSDGLTDDFSQHADRQQAALRGYPRVHEFDPGTVSHFRAHASDSVSMHRHCAAHP